MRERLRGGLLHRSRSGRSETSGHAPNDFGDSGGESDDVVFDLGLDLKDAFHIEAGAPADSLGSLFRHDAGLRQRLGRGDFDREPSAEAVFVTPDAGHLGPGVAWDHGALSLRGTVDCKSEWRYRLRAAG